MIHMWLLCDDFCRWNRSRTIKSYSLLVMFNHHILYDRCQKTVSKISLKGLHNFILELPFLAAKQTNKCVDFDVMRLNILSLFNFGQGVWSIEFNGFHWIECFIKWWNDVEDLFSLQTSGSCPTTHGLVDVYLRTWKCIRCCRNGSTT